MVMNIVPMCYSTHVYMVTVFVGYCDFHNFGHKYNCGVSKEAHT